MKYRIPSVVLVAALIISCSEAQKDPTEVVTPNFDGASGCYTPKFSVVGAPTSIPWIFEGQVTGDLEGSATWVFDLGSITFTGNTVSNSGTWHFTITGGIIPGLGAFDTEFHNRNQLVDNPATPGTVFENHGSLRALDGVSKANLTYQGTFWAVPSPHGVWDFLGVICP